MTNGYSGVTSYETCEPNVGVLLILLWNSGVRGSIGIMSPSRNLNYIFRGDVVL